MDKRLEFQSPHTERFPFVFSGITSIFVRIKTGTMKTQLNVCLVFWLVMMLFPSINLAGQDVIQLKDTKKIEAKVLEVEDASISYKMFNNLDGPTFKISTDKVYKIVFENGSEYALVEEPKSHNLAQNASLPELTADGNNVFVVFQDNSGTFDEKDEYVKEYLKELTKWNIVEVPENADFILYIEGYSKRTAKSFTNDTYFLTAKIRRPDNTDVWTGETVNDFPNLYNGYLAVKGVSKKLVEKSLLKDMKKAK